MLVTRLMTNDAHAPVNLKPKEHGAYAIVSIPILVALILTGPTPAGLCIATASIAGFLAHEPLLVAMGRRGERARRSTPQAKSRLIQLVTVSIFSGLVALTVVSAHVRWAIVACLGLALVSIAIAIAGQHRTTFGQLWGVVGLSAPTFPVLLAGSFSLDDALRVWSIFLIGFASTTMAVRQVIAHQKHQSSWAPWIVMLGVSFGLVAIGWIEGPWIAAVVPMVMTSWILMCLPPSTKNLKQLGWSLVAVSLLTAACVAVGFWSK
jgi:hypothetical protein